MSNFNGDSYLEGYKEGYRNGYANGRKDVKTETIEDNFYIYDFTDVTLSPEQVIDTAGFEACAKLQGIEKAVYDYIGGKWPKAKNEVTDRVNATIEQYNKKLKETPND